MADELNEVLKTTTISESPLVQIRLINEGAPYTYSPKRSHGRKTINIGRVWQVLYEGQVIGGIRHSMLTRERRVPGRRYVESRWESPGWQDTHKDPAEHWNAFHRAGECYTKKDGIERLVREHERANKLGFWANRD